MKRMSALVAAVVLGGGLLQPHAEGAERKADPSSKSDPDLPVISGTVPNPKKTRVKKVDALTWKMKGQGVKEGAGLKAKDGGRPRSDPRSWKSRAGHKLD